MDLKELFTQKQPNYVQFPPQETPTLEKFISERAMIPHDAVPVPEAAPKKIPNMFGGSLMPGGDSVSSAYAAPKSVVDPVDAESKKAALESDPVSEERLAEIKSIFGIPSEAGNAAPSDVELPQRQPAMDIASIKKTMDKDGYKLGFEDMLPALAPLAADLFTGGTGAGIPVAAGYLDKIQKDTASKNANLEKYLMDIEKSRATAKEKARSGLSNEEWAARELFKAGLKQKFKSADVDKKDQERIIKLETQLSKEWRQDPFTKDTRKVADSFRRIMAVDPSKGDPVEDMGLIFDLMRALDPASVVRESEQSMAIGARSYEDVANYFTDLMSGNRKMTPTQVQNIKKFAAKLYSKRLEGQSQIDSAFRKKAAKYELDPEMIVDQIGDKIPVLWTNRKTGKTDVILLTPNKVEAAIQAGAKRF